MLLLFSPNGVVWPHPPEMEPGNYSLIACWPHDSVCSTCIMAAAVSSCCRLLGSRICSQSSLISPVMQLSSPSCRGEIIRSTARLPLRCPRAYYYVKPKEKKGPSLRGWVMFGAGCVGMATGAVIYMGKKDSEYTKVLTVPFDKDRTHRSKLLAANTYRDNWGIWNWILNLNIEIGHSIFHQDLPFTVMEFIC